MWSRSLGKITNVNHNIDLKIDSCLALQHPYQAGPKTKEHEEEKTEKMLKKGVIKLKISERASPVVLSSKKNEKLSFYVSYRELIAMKVRDAYPLQWVHECVHSLRAAAIFSTINCSGWYWRIEIIKPDHYKAIFSSHRGLLRLVPITSGLKSAPESF